MAWKGLSVACTIYVVTQGAVLKGRQQNATYELTPLLAKALQPPRHHPDLRGEACTGQDSSCCTAAWGGTSGGAKALALSFVTSPLAKEGLSIKTTIPAQSESLNRARLVLVHMPSASDTSYRHLCKSKAAVR